MFEVRQEVLNYFSKIFNEVNLNKPCLDELVFHTLSDKDNLALRANFSSQDLDFAIILCDDNKSPRPDVFCFSFLKRFWNLFRGELKVSYPNF